MRPGVSMNTMFRQLPLAVLSFALVGCIDDPPPPRGDDVATAPPAPPALWSEVDGSQQVVLTPDAEDEALRAAIERARDTAEDARRRWLATPPDERGEWAVKWCAPTDDGGIEYVWVEPMTWSPFRIEGRLASPPRRALACGRALDEIVGFPVEELVDWMREGAEREGGFTVEVLEQRYGGRPSP